MTTGIAGAMYYTSFTRRGLSSELVFESPEAWVNTSRLESLEAQKDTVEGGYRRTLDWQRLPGRKATRVADYSLDADVAREEPGDSYVEWLLDRQTRLRAACSAVGGVPDIPAAWPGAETDGLGL